MLQRFVLSVIGVGLLSSLLTACGPRDQVQTIGGPTMGSTYTIQYLRHADGPPPELVRAEVEAILAQVDQQLSTYRSDSDIERFNALPANTCQAMPPAVLQLVAIGDRLSRESAGAFDLTVEPLLDLWGFGPQGREEQVPDAQALAQAMRRVGYTHLRIEGELLCKDAPVQVDFNSIAAGYAVDRISTRLGELGIDSFLAEATGELKAIGKKPDGSPWRVALEEPRDDRQVAQRILAIDGYGVSTSGDYRHYFEQDGRRYSHTLDARTGAPITHGLAAVTVIHASALMADGLSSLLLILGPEQGEAYARRHGIAAVFVVRAEGGFVSRTSAGFDKLFAGSTAQVKDR